MSSSRHIPRALACRQTLFRSSQIQTQMQVRRQSRKAGDIGHEKEHVTDKPKTDSKVNVHSEASHAGREEKATGNSHSQAVSQKDHRSSNERAKRDFPEAPEPVIGMNTERGGKGY